MSDVRADVRVLSMAEWLLGAAAALALTKFVPAPTGLHYRMSIHALSVSFSIVMSVHGLSTAVRICPRQLAQILLRYQPIWLANPAIEQYHIVCPDVQAFQPRGL